MKERPILFSAPMVRAILDGSKSQTRRVVKPPFKGHDLVELRAHEGDHRFSGEHNDPFSWGYPYADDGAPMVLGQWVELCPYGMPGDQLWVRETYFGNHFQHPHEPVDERELHYRADGLPCFEGEENDIAWRPSIHMPRWASRISLEVTAVRIERAQGITELDALAEGVGGVHATMPTARERFEWLWRSINGAESWTANPWVWVIEFKRIEQ